MYLSAGEAAAPAISALLSAFLTVHSNYTTQGQWRPHCGFHYLRMKFVFYLQLRAGDTGLTSSKKQGCT